MNFEPDPAIGAFRDEVRTFLRERLPPDMARRTQRGYHAPKADMVAWTRILYARGWSAPHWPVEHGGPGWTPLQRHLFEEECALAGAPPTCTSAFSLVAPVIYTHGSEAQRRQHLPPILRGETFWGQGFSEPNAGSDLASLKTRAERDGDHYIVNGQKTWTTEGHHADWLFCLVRTSATEKPQRGISFLLVDARTPGITIRPIISIDDAHSLNEVFFDNVRIPDSQVLGGVNNGWAVGLTTLMYERLALGFGLQVRLRIAVDSLIELARRMEKEGRQLTKDPVMRQKIAQLWIDTESLRLTGARAITKLLKGELPGPEASTGKMMWVEGHQRLQELAMEIEGPFSQLTQGSPWAVAGGLWQHTFLRSRANSIEGGTTEIQRNIIGERVLGLPKG